MLDQQITQITNRSGEDCDEKIRELLEKFQGFVTRIGEWEGDASRFEGLLAALKTEIDRLCDKADEIIAKNDQNKAFGSTDAIAAAFGSMLLATKSNPKTNGACGAGSMYL